MHVFLECEVLGEGQRTFRRDQTLNNRVVCEVHEHCNVGGNSALLKCPAEEICDIVLNTHCGKDDCEFLIGIIAQGSLLYDLSGELVVRKTISGENRKFLTADQRH